MLRQSAKSQKVNSATYISDVVYGCGICQRVSSNSIVFLIVGACVLLTQGDEVNKEDSDGRQPNFEGDIFDVDFLIFDFVIFDVDFVIRYFSWSNPLTSIMPVERVTRDPKVEEEGEEEVYGGDEEVDECNAGLIKPGDQQQH